MLRYTQDSWKNKSPAAIENLWGDDPFPAVDSNWDQPAARSRRSSPGTSAPPR